MKRCRLEAMWLIWVLPAVVCMSGYVAFGVSYETPCNSSIYVFKPICYPFSDNSMAWYVNPSYDYIMRTWMTDEGYSQLDPGTSYMGLANSLSKNDNLWVTSHGGCGLVGTNFFPRTEQGCTDCLSLYNSLIPPNGTVPTTCISWDWVVHEPDDWYVIDMRPAGFSYFSNLYNPATGCARGEHPEYNVPAHQICFIAACESADCIGSIACGLAVGYVGTATVSEPCQDATKLFKDMAGQADNATRRYSGGALQNGGDLDNYNTNFTNGSPGGDSIGILVLCPALNSRNLVESDCVTGTQTWSLLFDSKMNTNALPTLTGQAASAQWTSQDTLAVTATGLQEGVAYEVTVGYCYSQYGGFAADYNRVSPNTETYIFGSTPF